MDEQALKKMKKELRDMDRRLKQISSNVHFLAQKVNAIEEELGGD